MKTTITVSDIFSMDVIKSMGSWKQAKKTLTRLLDLCLENGAMESWEFSHKKKIDSYKSFHNAKVHLEFKNKRQEETFGYNLSQALARLDDELYVKVIVKAKDYCDMDKAQQINDENGLEDAKDFVSESLSEYVDKGLLTDWDVDVEPENIEALKDLDVQLVFLNEEQLEEFQKATGTDLITAIEEQAEAADEAAEEPAVEESEAAEEIIEETAA